jgi:hypothetical protein
VRDRAYNRHHGDHHDGESQQTSLEDCLTRSWFFASSAKSIIIIAFLLNNADEENPTNHGDDARLRLEDSRRQDSACANQGRLGQNSDWTNIALVENAYHDIDRRERRRDPDRFVASDFQTLGPSLSGRGRISYLSALTRRTAPDSRGPQLAGVGSDLVPRGLGRSQNLP